MKRHLTTYSTRTAFSIAIALLAVLFIGQNAAAQSPLRPNLGTASTYAIFTGSGAINNTGLSVLVGDVGQDGSYDFNGFPPGTYTGTLNRANGASALAKADLLTAWTVEASVTDDYVLGVGIVDGQSFDPAVYHSGAATTTTGNITFNAHGNANAIFIVKIGGQLDANAGTHILLANNARAANIYWFVDGAVNIADGSSFKGTIFARGAISFYGTSSLDGRALVAPGGAINISANHMAVSTDSGNANNLTVLKPAFRDSIKSGMLNDTIKWSGTGIAQSKTLEYSLDSGHTWTTIATINNDSLVHSWHVPDTTSTKAFVRITDANNLRGVSGLFTIYKNKIIVTNPMLASTITGGTQAYQVTWTGSGLNHIKTFALSLDSGATWTTIGKDTTNGFTYLWNVPDTVSTKAIVRITDSNNVTGMSGLFTIKSSKITVLHPATAEMITGGTQNYQITWSGTGLTPKKTFYYSLDSGTTWRTIGTISANVFTYSWNVPDTFSTKAFIRITDSNNVTGMSGLFTIKSSKIIVVHPAFAEVINGGAQNYQITWTGTGLATQKTFEYSLDGGATWKTIGVLNADVFSYNWNVPDTISTQAVIRITDKNGVTGKSSLFTIKSSVTAAIFVLRPQLGEVIVGGTQNYQITWTGTKIGATKTIHYSLDNGATWTMIGVLNGAAMFYSWNVPDTAATQAIVRITDNNGTVGKSGVFTISRKLSPGKIVINNPAKDEVIVGGTQNYTIMFSAENVTPQKTLEYSLDGGTTWNLIGTMNSEGQSFTWANVPNVATTQALVRITDGNGVVGTSGLFTITLTQGKGSLNSLTLSGLDNKNNIGNNKSLGISWAYTPDIGTSVEVEYSLDNMFTWGHVATVPTTESPNAATWMTPTIGYYYPVYIRVTSSKGMTLTSIPFSIGSNASVSSGASQNGYSVSNYPNPVSEQTTISIELPVRSDVTLIVSDNLGRQVSIISETFESGMHTIPFNTTGLSDGVYTYTLIAGTTRLSGRMNLIR